jgi:hypothetical protein
MNDKVWTLTLCLRCKADFEKSGYALVKHGWQEAAESCEFCQTGRGFDYDIFSNDGRGYP